jgi:4-amino-4-deoxy-L-arabinose transferase-like glycosyltransferase
MGETAVARALTRLHATTSSERLAFTLVVAVAAGFTLPWLGSFGFFDPWETHYAEVARQMGVRDDYLYPYWKDGYFFSKPILLFWVTAPLYRLLGAHRPDGPIPDLAELAGRLPTAAISLMTVAVVYLAARRLWSRRAAVLSGIVLSTIPFWAFMSRQAITDMLYVGPSSICLLLLAIAFFDDETRDALREAPIPKWMIALFGLALIPQLWEIGRTGAFLNRVALLGTEIATRVAASVVLCAIAGAGLFYLARRGRDPLLHAAAFFGALATLGKGPVGVALVGMVLFFYFVATNEWRWLKRGAFTTAILLFIGIAAPWYVVMFLFEGMDDGRKTWFQRFVLYDLLGRIGGGVHGDRGTSEYYVKYLGIGLFPWSGIFPIALISGAKERLASTFADRTKAQRFTILVAIWAIAYFAFFTATTTKFHHYIFPVVVPAALLIGRWLDRLLDDERRLPIGIAVFAFLVTLQYARDIVLEPWQLADIFTYHYKSYDPNYYFPAEFGWPENGMWPDLASTPWPAVLGVFVFLASLLIAVGAFTDGLADRFRVFGAIARTGQAALGGTKRLVNAGFVAVVLVGAIGFGLFATHVYFARMSQHWSQRWMSETYYAMSPKGDEPLLSYQMDWKGETFYWKNKDVQIKKSAQDLKKEVDKPGRAFILVQTDRFGGLKSALGKEYEAKTRVVDRSNKKWYLVLVE